MSTEAYDIVVAIDSLIDTGKVEIKSVSSIYKTLDELEEEARKTPANFPKAIVWFGASESPDTSQTIGSTLRYFLQIGIDIYVIRDTDIQLEREIALKEVRDKIELPANSLLTANNHRIVLPVINVQRLITYESGDPHELVFGLASINFNVMYSFIQGDS